MRAVPPDRPSTRRAAMVPTSCLLLVVFSASGATAAPVPSQPAPVTLMWSAPEGCPTEGQVRAAVEAMVDMAVARPDAPALAARATVTEAAGRFTLSIHIEESGISEDKTIEADACATLADACAIVVAFALDPGAGVRQSPQESPPAPTASPVMAQVHSLERALAPTPTLSPPVRAVPAAAAPDVPRHTDLLVGPLIATGAGLLPFPALGLGARLALEAGLRWELAGMYWPDRQTAVAPTPAHTVGAAVGLASIEPSVCLGPGSGDLASCLGLEAGAMTATGTGVAFPHRGTSWWLAIKASVGVRLRLTPAVDVRLRLEGGLPLFRPSFLLENVGPADPVRAYQPAPGYALVSVEPEVRIFSTDSGGRGHAQR